MTISSREFRELCDSTRLQAKIRKFDPKTDRGDTLLYETVGTEPSFVRAWDVVKIVLVSGTAKYGERITKN